LPLPAVPPDLGTWHAVTVHRDCQVSFERALYSVPFALVGKPLWLRATDAVVTVDRLRHNAYCLTLDGASYRAPRQGPNRAKNALASTPKNIDS